MNTLLDLLPRLRALGPAECLRYSDGLQTSTWSYQELDQNIARFAAYLQAEAMGRGDRLLLWSENRPEWIAVFWACLIRGVVVVPVDAHSTDTRVGRIEDEAATRLRVSSLSLSSTAREGSRFAIEELTGLPLPPDLEPSTLAADDVVEILYTSGTTAAPKGVVHRHRNICANLTPIGREIDRYRKWMRPFQPIRILDTVPLSHMFGQSMGIFIPVLLGGSVVFTSELHPAAIRSAVKSNRVSVLVTVPHVMDTLRKSVERRYPDATGESQKRMDILRRWWKYRKVHRAFGLKFWCFVVGGAHLNRETEDFWSRIGLLVIQGYGLTETSPVVAVNHPFHAKRGTVGKGIGQQEIHIADDGEIWVRGPSVVDEYVQGPDQILSATDAEGWFHTGDLGALDTEGNLIYRGRKKDVIVRADGLNVYPDDVEQVLNQVPGIRDSVVLPLGAASGEEVHAVLILDSPDMDVAQRVGQANRRLEPEQRIQSWSIWPDEDFPRTSLTLKVQRHIVRDRIAHAPSPDEKSSEGSDPFARAVANLTNRSETGLGLDTHISNELGLSSLERIDLLAGLEDRYGIELDEEQFSQAPTIRALEAQVRSARSHNGSTREDWERSETLHLSLPRWSRYPLVETARRWFHAVLLRPVVACFVSLRVTGAELLAEVPAPVLFAANHASHLDTPVILIGLSPEWRRRIAPAVREEYFTSGRSRLLGQLQYFLVSAAFNTYPMPQQVRRVRDSIRYTGELISAGYCPLVFPEGGRTLDGTVGPFQPGIGFMAVRLKIPVVPVRLEGTFGVLPVGSRWPRRGQVRLRLGPPLRPNADESYVDFTQRLESALISLD